MPCSRVHWYLVPVFTDTLFLCLLMLCSCVHWHFFLCLFPVFTDTLFMCSPLPCSCVDWRLVGVFTAGRGVRTQRASRQQHHAGRPVGSLWRVRQQRGEADEGAGRLPHSAGTGPPHLSSTGHRSSPSSYSLVPIIIYFCHHRQLRCNVTVLCCAASLRQDSPVLCFAVTLQYYADSKHRFTTSFLQPLPYLVTP